MLVVEYRFVGEQAKDGPDWGFRNSGVMIHGQAVETMRRDQDFPISIEVQLARRPRRRPAAADREPLHAGHGRRHGRQAGDAHCVESSSPTFDGDQWVRVEVEVHGYGHVVHRVNGETVLTYEKPQYGGGNVAKHDPAVKKDGQLLEGGSISLQAESHPVEFRKVELLNLVGCTDQKSKSYRPYFEKSDPTTCR